MIWRAAYEVLRKSHHATRLLNRALFEEIRALRPRRDQRPKIINFLITDVCNSRCEMCFIWKNKYENEIKPEEFESYLNDPLFANVEHIGVTGGEPTLRPDIAEFFEIACRRLPGLRGMSLITNALSPEIGAKRIIAARDVCERYGKPFSAMISLDGLYGVHDRSRGRAGNFQKALRLHCILRKNGVSVNYACTITKVNCLRVDELLDWAIEENVYVRFRIGEFIERLRNSESEVIRSFDEYEKYHLTLFFWRLVQHYETDRSVLKTYRNIIHMISEEPVRQIGCPYQKDGVVLTAKCEISYCAPKSPTIGSLREQSSGSGLETYLENIPVRDQIIANHCSNCIHDYHVPATAREEIKEHARRVFGRRSKFSLDRLIRKSET